MACGGGTRHVDARELQHHEHMRLQTAVREMEPVEIVGVVLVRGRERELPVAVHVDDVFGAGGGLGEREASVLYDGGRAERAQVLDGLGGEDGGALVQGQRVGNLQFFAQPGKALRLRDLEVVDC